MKKKTYNSKNMKSLLVYKALIILTGFWILAYSIPIKIKAPNLVRDLVSNYRYQIKIDVGQNCKIRSD